MATDTSRRALLGLTVASVAVVAAGCGGHTASPRPASTEPPGNDDDAAVTTAIQDELRLIAAYEAVMGPHHDATLSHLLDQHRDHAAALRQLLPTAPPSGPGRGSSPGRDLLAVERASVERLGAAALTADGRTAPVLASVAASHAAHVAALQALPGRDR